MWEKVRLACDEHFRQRNFEPRKKRGAEDFGFPEKAVTNVLRVNEREHFDARARRVDNAIFRHARFYLIISRDERRARSVGHGQCAPASAVPITPLSISRGSPDATTSSQYSTQLSFFTRMYWSFFSWMSAELPAAGVS